MRRDKTTRRLPRQATKPRSNTDPVIEALERNLEDLKRLEASSAAMLGALDAADVKSGLPV